MYVVGCRASKELWMRLFSLQGPASVWTQAVAVLLRTDLRRLHQAVEVPAAAQVSSSLIPVLMYELQGNLSGWCFTTRTRWVQTKQQVRLEWVSMRPNDVRVPQRRLTLWVRSWLNTLMVWCSVLYDLLTGRSWTAATAWRDGRLGKWHPKLDNFTTTTSKSNNCLTVVCYYIDIYSLFIYYSHIYIFICIYK